MSGGWNVRTPKSRLRSSSSVGDLPRRHAPDVDARLRVLPREPLDDRQQRVDGRLVGADDDAAAPHLLQLADRGLRLGGEPQEPGGMLAQQDARPRSACRCATIRSKSRSPSSSSSRRMAWLMAGWVRWSFLAAFEKLRSVGDGDEGVQVLQLHGAIISNY